jgi:hypothetical protein
MRISGAGDVHMSQSEHDRRIDYIEFPVADVAVAKRFHFRDPCGHELAVWSDPAVGEKE